MKAIQMEARALMAPASLGLDTRVEFRQAAVEALNALPDGGGPLVIELAGTRTVDSAGLGVLMLVQRHAAYYQHCDLPKDTLDAFLNAPSMGRYYRANIEDADGSGPYACRTHKMPSDQ